MDFSQLIKLLPLFLSGGGNNNLTNFEQLLKPILSSFGLSGDDAETVIEATKRILSGEINLKQLLPLLIPIALEFLNKNQQINNAPTENVETLENFQKLEPIQNFADEKILSSLSTYLENDTAS